ncbi:MAG: glycosyltransferase family 2 protein [Campylobacterales bacterium]
MIAPIALFVYDRLDMTIKTVDALKNNTLAQESSLFIYSDAAKDASNFAEVEKIREYILGIVGFKEVAIIRREKNFGLAENIIDGVGSLVEKYGRVIVLEDDLITHPRFLEFMNNGLDTYENDMNVASIHGFVYPIKDLPETFFLKGADCWGWATWNRAWRVYFGGSYPYTKMLKDQINGRNNSWAIRWYASAFLRNMVTLYPKESLVAHIGYCGTHTRWYSRYDNSNGTINTEYIPTLKKIDTIVIEEVLEKFERYFKHRKINIVINILKNYLFKKS